METSSMTREMRVLHVSNEKSYRTIASSYRYIDKPFFFFTKRSFDIIGSIVGIILALPIILILAIVIKCSSKGPILYKDPRMGRNGRIIKVLKFRTMYIDAETNCKKYLTKKQYSQWKKERKIENDPRITKVGRFLRKTSLDELPQLLNIFIGQMSFVGPRAITEKELKTHYTKDEQSIILSMRPGLTGYWQAYGRSNVTFESGKRQGMDLYYVYNSSLIFDTKILFHTIPAVLKNDGAK